MEYSSLLDPELSCSFKEAVTQGLAVDGSLFVPRTLPKLDTSFIREQNAFDLKESAFSILEPFVGSDLNDDQLRKVIAHTFQFDLPIIQLAGSDIFIEELFHGPTHAFKDVGARFLAGCLAQWREPGEKITVLVATSGDTGGAVANAFYGLEGIRVIVLYPKGKISSYQEQQIVGLGKNITAIAVNGSFDHCQQLVKQAFSENELSSKIRLTSANSINIGRWIPQMLFYAKAWHFLEKNKLEKSIVVPSGNYGNITAGLLFHRLGFHFDQLVAAHNQNDTIPRFLISQQYQPHPTVTTFANAMDVSDPSNFVRFQFLNKMKNGTPVLFDAASVSDQDILNSIKKCWEKYNYLVDPHTATAYTILNARGGEGLILSTAHPFKFKEIVVKALGSYPDEWRLEDKAGSLSVMEMPGQFESLKEILLQP